MNTEEHTQECNDALNKLVGKKILNIEYKRCDENCWKLYITTDNDKMVMTFCKKWICPEVELRR